MMPGMINPFAASGGPRFAAINFDGTGKRLEKTVSSSNPNRKTFSISAWLKFSAFSSEQGIVDYSDGTLDNYTSIGYDGTHYSVELWASSGGADLAFEHGPNSGLVVNIWYHFAFLVDTTLAYQHDRVRKYLNGNLLTPSAETNPAQNADMYVFVNGSTLTIGAEAGGYGRYRGKLAFLDVVEGVSVAPTDFAFSNGGVWTRKPYGGSYGAHGFKLDGTTGFGDFTAVSMTTDANLDYADLPPYIG